MKRLQLCIFHYHLLPGGVTAVAMGWANILVRYRREIFPQYEQLALRICCGNPDNIAQLQAQNSRLTSVQFVVDRELGYRTDSGDVSKLAEHLLRQYKAEGWDNLWWVHNYHLGKNATYTQALLQLIENSRELKFLLQIHDFPECGRFSLYKNLIDSAQLYPATENVCYATINKRDFQILCEAGLPEERLFFLPNPLNFQPLNCHREPSLRAELCQKLALPDRRLALYPVRCIRRKNVLELALLNQLAAEPWNLVCTLPGRSAAEQPYSQLVAALYQEGIIPGRCHVGLELEAQGWSFDMLCQAADFIVSSSVMEGFGFTYFNPMYWGKILLARYLDVLQGFEHCFEPQLVLFYREVKIPFRRSDGSVDPELAEIYARLRQKYRDYAAQLPLLVQRELRKNLHPAAPLPEYLDFAQLSVAQQKQLLLRLKHDDCLLADCQQANSDLLKKLDTLMSGSCRQEAQERSRQRLAAEFAPQRLAAILQACVAALYSTPKTQEENLDSAKTIGRKVLQAFSRLEYHYAILWDNDY